ncbi:hypothetical protein NC797_07555 [Aquibacillus sp. 3ASR75-11]|uniref:Uncharacterized protein n=1 Tax=Terrihalobacillus insolitus TaxID=2950438 RepID=A0A9X4ALL3_9BACI|nr:hypothetical protein [Terrihalobacillus insolitus]MDC3424361.1 hypothetical protein [Terrihalobacillus insolitus]
MYKITCFTSITPNELGKALKGFRFLTTKEGFEWKVDGYSFRIEPFKNQPRHNMNGYRVYFDGSIDGGIYLFDMAIGWTHPKITGVEFDLSVSSRTSKDWINDLISRNSFRTIDTRGLFRKGKVGVIAVNDTVTLQIRSTKGKQLKLIECLKEVEKIREEITPVEFDLFSFIEEGEAG